MSSSIPNTALPGAILGSVSMYNPGAGTHVHNGNVVASVLGRVSVQQPAKQGPVKRLTKLSVLSQPQEYPTISVSRHVRPQELLPEVGNTVLCRVIRLMPKQAIVSIQQVQNTVLQTEWQGVIRSQDVRATEKDKVKIHESFKPGDVVRATVVSFFFLLLLWCTQKHKR